VTLPQASDCSVRRSSLSSMPVRCLISEKEMVSFSLNNIKITVW